jgi:undecaprenyl-diphosphatase
VAHLGDGPLVFGGLGLVYGVGWLGANVQLRQTVLMTIFLVLAAMIVVTLIKFMARRQRPQPPGEFVTFQYDIYSFPSGHAARLAALAVSVMFFDVLLGWSLVVLAICVVVARIAVGIHYVSDVVIGLGLGALVAWAGLVLLSYVSG